MKLLSILIFFPLASMAVDLAKSPRSATNRTNVFVVTGMTCEGCAGGLRADLSATKGVSSVQVTLTNKQAIVVFDPNTVPTAALLKVIEEAGFKATVKSK